jgi:hypothetical protein
MTTASVKENFWRSAVAAAFCAGIAVRLWFYLVNDSFWRDETKLLLNAALTSFPDLLAPLTYPQESPTGFLWPLRALWLSGMNGETAMRSISLLASLLSLFVFYRLLSIAVRSAGAKAFSLWLFALSPGLVLFAGMAKQYSFDLLVATVLVYSSLRWFISSRGDTVRIHPMHFVLVALAPWFSLPSIFIIAAMCAGLAMKYGRRHFYTVLLFTSTACASFLVEWVLVLHRCLGLTPLLESNFAHFARIENWLYIFEQVFFSCTGPNLSFPLVIGLSAAGILLPIGILTAKRYGSLPLLTLLFLPLLLSLGASAAKVYPLYGRCLLFAVPGIYLLMGYGIERLAGSRGRSLVIGAVLA